VAGNLPSRLVPSGMKRQRSMLHVAKRRCRPHR